MCPLECALINVSGWWMSVGSVRARDRHWGYGLALEGVRVVGESGGGGGGEESAREQQWRRAVTVSRGHASE